MLIKLLRFIFAVDKVSFERMNAYFARGFFSNRIYIYPFVCVPYELEIEKIQSIWNKKKNKKNRTEKIAFNRSDTHS